MASKSVVSETDKLRSDVFKTLYEVQLAELKEIKKLQELREKVSNRIYIPGRLIRLLIINRRIKKAIGRHNAINAMY